MIEVTKRLADSIRTFGFTNPVLVNRSRMIIAGHGRVAAAKLLGISQVPTICLDNLTEDEIRAYILADNKLAEKAGWDHSILAIELQHLTSVDLEFDVSITGFEVGEVDLILQEVVAAEGQEEKEPVEIRSGPAVTQRDLHLDAIRDRSEVLALKETSPDRRYIAFVRRSESYEQLGMIDEALGDLTTIQAVDDISPEQKSEAWFQRGMLYKDLDRLSEAREDLEAVCSTDELFPGVFARAVVGLSDLARRSGDLAGAREYLDAATNSEDAGEETLVEALIVWARVLTDQGHLSDAENTWQSVLNNPAATARQRSIATSRRGPAANH